MKKLIITTLLLVCVLSLNAQSFYMKAVETSYASESTDWEYTLFESNSNIPIIVNYDNGSVYIESKDIQEFKFTSHIERKTMASPKMGKIINNTYGAVDKDGIKTMIMIYTSKKYIDIFIVYNDIRFNYKCYTNSITEINN